MHTAAATADNGQIWLRSKDNMGLRTPSFKIKIKNPVFT